MQSLDHDGVRRLAQDYEKLRFAHRNLERSFATLQKKVDSTSGENLRFSERVKLESEIKALTSELSKEKLRHTADLRKEEIEHGGVSTALRETLEEALKRRTEAEEQRADAEKKSLHLEEEIAVLREEVARAQEKATSSEEDMSSKNELAAALRQERLALQEERSARLADEKKLVRAEEDVARAEEKLARTEEDVARAEGKLVRAEAALATAEEKLATQKQQMIESEAQNAQLREQCAGRDAEIKELKERAHDVDVLRQRLEAQGAAAQGRDARARHVGQELQHVHDEELRQLKEENNELREAMECSEPTEDLQQQLRDAVQLAQEKDEDLRKLRKDYESLDEMCVTLAGDHDVLRAANDNLLHTHESAYKSLMLECARLTDENVKLHEQLARLHDQLDTTFESAHSQAGISEGEQSSRPLRIQADNDDDEQDKESADDDAVDAALSVIQAHYLRRKKAEEELSRSAEIDKAVTTIQERFLEAQQKSAPPPSIAARGQAKFLNLAREASTESSPPVEGEDAGKASIAARGQAKFLCSQRPEGEGSEGEELKRLKEELRAKEAALMRQELELFKAKQKTTEALAEAEALRTATSQRTGPDLRAGESSASRGGGAMPSPPEESPDQSVRRLAGGAWLHARLPSPDVLQDMGSPPELHSSPRSEQGNELSNEIARLLSSPGSLSPPPRRRDQERIAALDRSLAASSHRSRSPLERRTKESRGVAHPALAQTMSMARRPGKWT